MKISLFATKSIARLRTDAESGPEIKRTLGAFDLTALGVGAIVGSGIFVITGAAAVSVG